MLTFHDLVRIYNLNPGSVRLVRHGNKEINVLDVFQKNKERFKKYSAWQKEGKYGDSQYLAMFSPARGTTSLFLGIWSVSGVTKNSELTHGHWKLLSKNDLPPSWFDTSVYYHLAQTEIISSLNAAPIVPGVSSRRRVVSTRSAWLFSSRQSGGPCRQASPVFVPQTSLLRNR